MSKKMKTKVSGSTVVMFTGIVAVGACAGTKLNDVGDIDGSGGTSRAGTSNSSGAGTSSSSEAGEGTSGVAKGGTANRGGSSPGGKGGADAGPAPIVEDAGAGGAGDEPLICDTCELLAETPDIRAVWATSDRVYWVEYGSFDGLGNYQDDGRLLSLAFAETEPKVVATGLEGPIQVRVTSNYAYVIIDHSSSVDGATQLARVSLDKGETALLDALPIDFQRTNASGNDWFRHDFTVSGNVVYWYKGDTVFRLPENSARPPETFRLIPNVMTILADDASLYVQDNHGIVQGPLAGDASGTPIWVGENSPNLTPLVLAGDAFYALEPSAKSYLTRLPKAGGVFKRQIEAPTGWASRLVTDGSSYVGDFGVRLLPDATGALIEGTIAASPQTRTLAIAPNDRHGNGRELPWRAWDATSTFVYIGFRDELYRVARQF